MHEKCVCVLCGSGLNEVKRGGHAGDQTFDIAAPLDLKTVGSVVTVGRRIENAVKQLNQFTNMQVGTNLDERPA